MPTQGFPVVIVEDKGVPIRPVESNYPLMTVAENGMGLPITISDLGAPFVVQGYEPVPEPELLTALSSDDGAPLIDDDENLMETY